MASPVRVVIKDNEGKPFDPDSLPHAYTYDANGNKLTDTCIEQGAIVRVKTYTYVQVGTAWLVETESAWVNASE
ncbi:hypothetical protein PQR39_35600 [Paraburkholderia sediminicola]|uniref:hypothetical protein n=1 Tax=Paraburkholderia sediminicola TaxID=458836 RepID=UPI0038B74B74